MVLSAAASIDGKIAAASGDSALSSPEDLRRVHRLRSRADAILVGAGTVRADDPMLTARPARGPRAAPGPLRVVLSSAGRVPLGSRVVRTARETPTAVACSGLAREGTRRALEARSVRVIEAGRARVDPGLLLEKLAAEGVRTAMLEGGGSTVWEFARLGLVDEIRVAVAPVLLGGSRSPTLADGAGFPTVRGSPRFRLERASRLGGDLVLRYARI